MWTCWRLTPNPLKTTEKEKKERKKEVWQYAENYSRAYTNTHNQITHSIKTTAESKRAFSICLMCLLWWFKVFFAIKNEDFIQENHNFISHKMNICFWMFLQTYQLKLIFFTSILVKHRLLTLLRSLQSFLGFCCLNWLPCFNTKLNMIFTFVLSFDNGGKFECDGVSCAWGLQSKMARSFNRKLI